VSGRAAGRRAEKDEYRPNTHVGCERIEGALELELPQARPYTRYWIVYELSKQLKCRLNTRGNLYNCRRMRMRRMGVAITTETRVRVEERLKTGPLYNV
jgi:hypothetical protein